MAIYSFSPFGYEGSLITIEVDLRRGIPAVDIVGLADSAVKESRERMQAAIRNSGFDFPPERVLISLSPADIKKDGAGFDLPIALAVLAEHRNLKTENILVMGELELGGKVRPVKAIHGACTTALASGIEYAIVPKGTDVPNGIKYREVESLEEAFEALCDLNSFKYKEQETGFSTEDKPIFDDFDEDCEESFDNLKLNGLKYAMTVAAAGRHNLITWGSPGCGKTMTLQMLPLITPRLTFEQAQSVTRIWSLAGLMRPNQSYVKVRPFRMPHQTASIEGMYGGGIGCRPGGISLAHNGILFLDEAAEFRSSCLQMLRVPLENHTITLCRAGRSTVFPANFQLVMATNPCPCGNYGSKEKICLCSAKTIDLYWKKFSAPLLDRMEIRYDCNADEVFSRKITLKEARELVTHAWKVQMKRQGKLNNELTSQEVLDYCKLSDDAQKHLESEIERKDLSPRAVTNILKVARTLHDMFDDTDVITDIDTALALYGKIEL